MDGLKEAMMPELVLLKELKVGGWLPAGGTNDDLSRSPSSSRTRTARFSTPTATVPSLARRGAEQKIMIEELV